MKLRFLVTGSGLIAAAFRSVHKHFCNYDFVFCPEADFRSPAEVASVFKEARPNFVIRADETYRIDDDAVAVLNLIRACEEHRVRKLLAFCGQDVYSPSLGECLESDLRVGRPEDGSLRFLDSQLEAGSGRVRSTLVVCPMVYGHGAPNFVQDVAEKMLSSADVLVRGGGETVREVIFSEDLAHLSMRAAEDMLAVYRRVNITSGIEMSYSGMAGAVAKEVGYGGRVEWSGDSVARYPRMATKVLNFINSKFSFIDFEEGVRRTVARLRKARLKT